MKNLGRIQKKIKNQKLNKMPLPKNFGNKKQ